ncbi:hypothetical protein Tco_1198513 [Tanacetum coccineum]
MNARLFFHSEEIPAAIKPYRTFQKEKKLEGNDLSGTVFEGYHYIRTERMSEKGEKIVGKSPVFIGQTGGAST